MNFENWDDDIGYLLYQEFSYTVEQYERLIRDMEHEATRMRELSSSSSFPSAPGNPPSYF